MEWLIVILLIVGVVVCSVWQYQVSCEIIDTSTTLSDSQRRFWRMGVGASLAILLIGVAIHILHR